MHDVGHTWADGLSTRNLLGIALHRDLVVQCRCVRNSEGNGEYQELTQVSGSNSVVYTVSSLVPGPVFVH